MSKELTLFDILNNISNERKSLLGDDYELPEYSEFMINRFLAHGDDTVFFANEASKMSNLPKKLQYLFLFYGLNKKKRYFKYSKADKADKYLKYIAEYYSVSQEVAAEYLELLTSKQLKEIKAVLEEGYERAKVR